MSFPVRLFGFRGITVVPQINPRQLVSDSVSNLTWPYEWRQLLSAGPEAASSEAENPDLAVVLLVEAPPGRRIRYELNPPNRSKRADARSPSLSGSETVDWGPGWTISIIEAKD
jgi:hypothetical protein